MPCWYIRTYVRVHVMRVCARKSNIKLPTRRPAVQLSSNRLGSGKVGFQYETQDRCWLSLTSRKSLIMHCQSKVQFAM